MPSGHEYTSKGEWCTHQETSQRMQSLEARVITLSESNHPLKVRISPYTQNIADPTLTDSQDKVESSTH